MVDCRLRQISHSRGGTITTHATHRRTVLVGEDNFSGHRWNYIQYLAKGARERGIDLRVVTTPEALTTLDEVASQEERALVTFSTVTDMSLPTLERAVTEARADRIVIPDGDRLALRVGVGVGARWNSTAELCLLVMRQEAQPRPRDIERRAIDLIRKALFRRAAAREHVIVRFLASALTETGDSKFAPDPVSMTPDAQSPVALNHETFWFGLLGALDERKNVSLVLDALKSLDREGIGVVLGGRQSSALRAELADVHVRYPFPIIVLDERLSEGALDALVRDVDCVVLAYSNSAPSGLIAKAASAGTRVVTSPSATFAADVRRIGPGAVTGELTRHGLANALARIMGEPRPEPIALDSSGFVKALLG